MPLINYEIILILTQSTDSVVSSAVRVTKFEITDTKLYVPVMNLMIMQNYCNNWNLVLKAQLIGTNIKQKYQWKDKIIT